MVPLLAGGAGCIYILFLCRPRRVFAENGTTPYDATLLTNVTINYAENEIDNVRETETEDADGEDGGHVLITETPRPGITLARPPRLPNHPGSAVGPFFEDGPEPHNVTAKLGTTVLLDCKIGLLYDKTVSARLQRPRTPLRYMVTFLLLL